MNRKKTLTIVEALKNDPSHYSNLIEKLKDNQIAFDIWPTS